MPKIIPHLWFDAQAEEAVDLYVSLFPGSRKGRTTRYTKAGFEFHGQPEGRLMTVEFELFGQAFIGLNGGPFFAFNPSVSFLAACAAREQVDALWAGLSPGGDVQMDLGAYPFSGRYGWVRDRYGLSWQLMLTDVHPAGPGITPTLMYTEGVCGKAEEAVRRYVALFGRSRLGDIDRYGDGDAPDKPGTVRHAGFTLEGRPFAAMDSARVHGFSFNEAVSFLVECETQSELDRLWEGLGEGGDPAARRCGWLKDRYGVSWQVTPAALADMMHDPDSAKVERLVEAFMHMEKLDLAVLKKAFEGGR